MKKYLFFLLFAFAQLLLWSSCHNCNDPADPKCPNYDPCYGKKPVSASFKIIETTDGYNELWQDYETDTIIGGYARFEADLIGAKYKWIIGAGTYEGRSVRLRFSSVPDSTMILITLIVEKTPDKTCNPSDDGIDTVTRNMYIRRESKVISIRTPYHRFKGSYKNTPQDTFTMTFFYDTVRYRYDTYVINLLRGTTLKIDCSKGYRQLTYMSTTGTVSAARAFVKPNDSIEVYFYTQTLDGPKNFNTFLGKKIQ